jgi:hypothetical protein
MEGMEQNGAWIQRKKMMLEKCGKKCFLGVGTCFPICDKKTCKVNTKGVYAAYVRARQFRKVSSKYGKIASKAKKTLKRRGAKR